MFTTSEKTNITNFNVSQAPFTIVCKYKVSKHFAANFGLSEKNDIQSTDKNYASKLGGGRREMFVF